MEKFQGKYRISSARLRTWDYSSEGIYFITICTKNREHYLGEIVTPNYNRKQNEMELSALGMEVEMEWLRTPEIRPDMNLSLGEFQVMPNHFHAILIIGENQFNNPADPRTDAMLASPADPIADTDAILASPGDSIADTDAMLASPADPIADTDAMLASPADPIADTDAMLASPADFNADTAEMYVSPFDSKSISDRESGNESFNNPDFNQISELENQMILQSNTKGKNKFGPQSKNLGSVMRGFKSTVSSFAMDNNIIFNWQPRYYDHVIRNHDEFMRISTYIRNNPANWKNDRLR
jgi:REP element-mobilizing transposase RayT